MTQQLAGTALSGIEVGDPGGTPAFYCHGYPGSALEAHFFDVSARAAGVRLIAADRPGIGGTPADTAFRLVDWPARVAALADAMGIGRFAMLGVSGGAPYALACGALLDHRVTRVVLGCPALPYALLHGAVGFPFRQMDLAYRRAPWALRLAMRGFAIPVRWLPNGFAVPPPPGLYPRADRDALRDPTFARIMTPSIRAAWRQGGDAVFREGERLREDWGFDVGALHCPVTMVHGSEDRVIPESLAAKWSASLPGADYRVLAGEGHFSLPFRCSAVLVEALRGRQEQAC